jgi:hypothetical protein
MIEDHPDGPLPKLRGISRFPAHDSILSRFGVSGKAGAIQSTVKNELYVSVGLQCDHHPAALDLPG